MTSLLEPPAAVDAKRVCLFCKENGHDVTMQRCAGQPEDSEGFHYFCPCCDRLDPKYRGQYHIIEDIKIPVDGEPVAESGDDGEDVVDEESDD